MATDLDRRAFLRGGFHREVDHLMRPPGNKGASFFEKCTRCGACSDACQESIIALDGEKRPFVDFTLGACTFCGECAKSCGTGALDTSLVDEWPWRARISQDCLSLNGVMCRACQDVCEPRAIRFQLRVGGIATPLLDNAVCTGCGECAGACPADAIDFEKLPTKEPEAVG